MATLALLSWEAQFFFLTSRMGKLEQRLNDGYSGI